MPIAWHVVSIPGVGKAPDAWAASTVGASRALELLFPLFEAWRRPRDPHP